MMETYDVAMTAREGVEEFFRRSGFSSDSYTAKWFLLKFGPVPVYLPNIPSRVKAVKIHDVHHVLTGYPATWHGEVEIGAWEVATGCTNYWAAWLLNFGSIGIGLFLCPSKLFRAFRRGMKTRTNLYHNFDYEEAMSTSVSELRERIGLADYP